MDYLLNILPWHLTFPWWFFPHIIPIEISFCFVRGNKRIMWVSDVAEWLKTHYVWNIFSWETTKTSPVLLYLTTLLHNTEAKHRMRSLRDDKSYGWLIIQNVMAWICHKQILCVCCYFFVQHLTIIWSVGVFLICMLRSTISAYLLTCHFLFADSFHKRWKTFILSHVFACI